MRSPASLLLHRTTASSGEPSLPLQPPASTQERTAEPAGSEMLMILLCPLVSLLGLWELYRCACGRHLSASSTFHPPPRGLSASSTFHPPPRGLSRMVIDALPAVSFVASPASSPPAAAAWWSSSECAICLAEFADGESVRVLPCCGHGFHVACVDAI